MTMTTKVKTETKQLVKFTPFLDDTKGLIGIYYYNQKHGYAFPELNLIKALKKSINYRQLKLKKHMLHGQTKFFEGIEAKEFNSRTSYFIVDESGRERCICTHLTSSNKFLGVQRLEGLSYFNLTLTKEGMKHLT